MTQLRTAWAWVRTHAWAVALVVLGLAVVVLGLVFRGVSRDLLLGWLDGLREKHGAQVEASRSKARGLDAQRAKLLHEAAQAAQARARLEGREEELEAEVQELEARVRGMGAEEVAAEFRKLEGR